MKSLYSILESLSDDAIYYHLGRIKLSWAKKTRKDSTKLQNLSGRAEIIKYAKENLAPIISNKESLIPRSQWDITQFVGVSEKQLMDAAWWTFFKWTRENHKKQHDIMLAFECSNTKPYMCCSVPAGFYGARYKGFCDMCAINAGAIPYELSNQYPVRFDEWAHAAEAPDIRYKYMMITGQRFLQYMKKLKYKHVIVCMQNPDTQIVFDEMLKHNIAGCKKWLHIVSDKDCHDGFLRANPQFRKSGLAITRFICSKYVQKKMQDEIRKYVPADQKEQFDEMCEICKEDSHSIQTKLDEFNEKYKIEPYDPEVGVSDTTDIINLDDVIKRDLQSKFKPHCARFIKKAVDGAEKFMEKEKPSDEEWHAARYIFSALDVLFDYYDAGELGSYNPKFWNECTDCDIEYHNIKKVLHDLLDDDPDWEPIKKCDYAWYYKPVAKHFKKTSKDMWNMSEDIMITSQKMTLKSLLDHGAI